MCLTVFRYIHEFRPDIVVLATGAHYFDIPDYTFAMGLIAEKIRDVRRTHKVPPKFIWKTINPGHMNCAPELVPIAISALAKQISIDNPYKWNLHKKYDEVSVNVSRALGMNVIDMSPLYLRPDGYVIMMKFFKI